MKISWAHGSSRVVKKSSKRRIMETARNWVQQRVEGGRIRYALHRESFDVASGEEAEFYAVDRRRDRLRRVHCKSPARAAPTPAIEICLKA
jgi:hypothetical protein